MECPDAMLKMSAAWRCRVRTFSGVRNWFWILSFAWGKSCVANIRALFMSLDSVSSLDLDVRRYSPSDSLQWKLKIEPPRESWSDFSESMVWVDPAFSAQAKSKSNVNTYILLLWTYRRIA